MAHRMVTDPRDVPRYPVPEVAAYVKMKPTTLRHWIRKDGDLKPLIRRPSSTDPRLSYNNLVEAYVLDALRNKMKVTMQAIRRGVDFVEKHHPEIGRFLLSERLRTRQGNLLVEALGRYENVGRGGQLEIPDVVRSYLQRIDYDQGLPIRLYPVTRTDDPSGPERIVILPEVGFGKPVTERNYIAASVIADRFRAGESVEDLAEDYDLGLIDVEEAIRAESVPAAA